VAKKITNRRKSVCVLPLKKPTESAYGITLGAGKIRRHWRPARLKPGASIAEMIDDERR
jgi:hypothetical protein